MYLNQVHITMSDSSKSRIRDEFGDMYDHKIIKSIKEGKDGKINGDNVDIRVQTSEQRLNSKDRDFHFFTSNYVVDRDSFKDLDQFSSLGDPTKISISQFLLNDREYNILLDSYSQVIGRDFSTCFKSFGWLHPVVKDAIKHDLDDIMCKKSEIYPIGLVLKNEAKYDDCFDIMQDYQDKLSGWYKRAGRG